MRNIYSVVMLLITLISTNTTVNAQCDPILRPDSSHLLLNSTVTSSAKVGNVLYLGGNFTTVGRLTGSLARLDAMTTGSLINVGSWPRVNGTVSEIISDGTGGWIISGTFSQVGTFTRNNIAQINAAGVVTTFNPNANGLVSTLYRNGTTLYVGGSFTNIGGQTRNNIASFDLTTGNITTWNPNINSTVNNITGSGSLIYAAGNFSLVGGLSRNRIAAIDATGTATAWSPTVTGTSVSKILINGTTAYIGGTFTSVNSTTRNNAAAIDINTGTLTSWNPAPNSSVYEMVIVGSNIIAGGSFSNIGSLSRNIVGEVDMNLGNATSRNFNLGSGTISAFKLAGNSLYIGGTFTVGNLSNIARLNLTTNTVDIWESNFNSSVFAIELSGNTLYAGGSFTTQNRSRTYVAAIDYAADTLLPWAPVLNGSVTALAADPNNVYMAGNFTTVNSSSRSRLASVSSSGLLSSWAPNPNSTVATLALNSNTLYVGGNFTSISSQGRNRLASFDIATNILNAWDPNVAGGTVQAMVIANSNLYFGGSFTSVNGTGTIRNRLASVGLSSGSVTGWNPSPDNTVATMAVSGTNIYVGGSFTQFGSTVQPRLAALDQTSGLPTSWNPFPNAAVSSISIDGGIIYVGGSFTTIGGQSRNSLAAVSIATGNANSWDPSPNNAITYLSVYGDRLLVSGSFSTISSQSNTPTVAQYNLLQTTPVVTITGNNSVCASTSVTFTAVTSAAGATYQWKRNAINVGTGASTYTVIPANNDQIQCVITVPAGCYSPTTATSNTITVSVTAPITPTVSISGNSTVCSGTPTTYTATTNLAAPTYQWMVNGNNVGTNNAGFTYTPSNGDVVTCKVITPTAGCFTTSSATSTPINVTITTPVPPTISISTASTTVCLNASVVFTATTNVTGASYQWKVNNINSGTNSPTFTTTALANNASVTCVVTIPVGGCYTASTSASNAIVMTVNPTITSTLSISGNVTPCATGTTTYTAITNMAGGTFQWKVNNVNVGTNSNTYAYTPAANDVLTCVVTAAAGTCYVPSTITSNALVIVPQASVTPTASVSGSNNLCASQSGTYNVTTNVTGGTYQWQVNSVNVSGTSPTYTYFPVNGDVVRCIVTVGGSGCYAAPTVTSAGFTVTVNNPALPTITINTTSPTTICSGTFVSYTSITNVIGGSYQWQVNGFDVIGANNPGFSYFPSNGDVINCVITIPSGGCYLASSSISTPITMTVTNSTVPVITITPNANNVCAGTVVNYTSSTNIIGGTYQWQVNSVNVGTSSTYNYSPANGDIITCTITVPGTGCYTTPTQSSAPLTMVVNNPVVPSVNVAPDVDTVCEGSNVILTATTNVTGATYLWKVNGFNAGTNSPTHTYVPSNNDIILCTIIAPPGCFSPSTATSQLKVLKTKPKANVSFGLGASPIAEVGTTIYVNTTVPSGINSYSIVWKNKGVAFATTTVPNASYTKTAGIDTITATLTPNDGCFLTTTSGAIYVHSVATGIKNVSKTALVEVYPNPFNDRFTIKGISTGDKVIVYDMTGKAVMMQQTIDAKQNTFQITVPELPAGSYMIRITDKDGSNKASLPVRKL